MYREGIDTPVPAPRSKDVDLDELNAKIVSQFRSGDKVAAYENVAVALETANRIVATWMDEPYRIFTVRHPLEFAIIVNSGLPNSDNCQTREPNIAETLYLTGASYYELENFEKALEFLENSLVFNPVSARTWLEIAEAHKKMKQWDKVIEASQVALEYAWLMTEIAHAHRAIAFAFSEQGKFEEAAAHVVLALDYVPKERAALDELDWIAHQGYDITQMSLERAIEICGEEKGVACSQLVVVSALSLLGSELLPFEAKEEIAYLMNSWSRELRSA